MHLLKVIYKYKVTSQQELGKVNEQEVKQLYLWFNFKPFLNLLM